MQYFQDEVEVFEGTRDHSYHDQGLEGTKGFNSILLQAPKKWSNSIRLNCI
jgi:hypothetical protein